MGSQYLQSLRTKLQKRIQRISSINNAIILHFAIKQFWGFLHDHTLLIGILHDLELRYPALGGQLYVMISDGRPINFNTEEEQAAAAYILFGICNGSAEEQLEATIGGYYTYGSTVMTEKINTFKSFFLETLYNYLDEQLDDQRVVLDLLRRYKHKCEWFHRERLYELWNTHTQIGEKLLSMDMYDFLHD